MKNKQVFQFTLFLMAIAGVAAVLYATQWGAALSDDSYSYIRPARQILAGIPPVFTAHYPPLLPLVVTLIGLFGVEPLEGIRLLNAALLGVNIILFGLICFRVTGKYGVSAAGALLFLFSSVMVEVHAWAMSEALYITWILAIILALHSYLQNRSLALLIAAAVFSAFAALTRYAGIGLTVGVALAVFLVTARRGLKTSLRNTAVYSAVAGGIFVLYPLLNPDALQKVSSFSGSLWSLPDLGGLSEGFYNILLWIMPGRLARGREALVFGAVLLAALLLVCAYAFLRRQSFRSIYAGVKRQPVIVVILFMILFSIFTLYQAHVSPVYRSPLDSRLLSPTHALILLLAACLLGLSWPHAGRIARFGIIALLLWTVFLYLPRSVSFVNRLHQQGAGFATAYWKNLEAARFLQANADREIVTTAPMGVYFATGMETTNIMPMNPDQLRAYLRERDGFLIVFNSMPLELYGYPAQEFLSGLTPVDQYSDCTVYQVTQ